MRKLLVYNVFLSDKYTLIFSSDSGWLIILWSIISGNTLEVNEQVTHRYYRIRAGSISVIKKIIDNSKVR